MMQWLLVAGAATQAGAMTTMHSSHIGAAEYAQFRVKHGHRSGKDHISYETREQLFHERLAAIKEHNSKESSWVAGVNKFADFTDEEFRGLLGFKRMARSEHGPSASPSLLQLTANGNMIKATPHQPTILSTVVDYRSTVKSANFVRDQGDCGSCWAVATVGALEMQSELKTGNTTKLSFSQLVDCVPNPHNCGGTGGCEGATAELGLEYVQHHGLQSEAHYHHHDGDDKCKGLKKHSAIALSGWHRLPTNEGKPLLNSIANHGPVVVSVDGGPWMAYSHGVFDSCDKDSTVNHAVLAIGFGEEKGKKYWLIRNSWGKEWGDHGFIKLLRHDNDNDYCGTDHDPKQGVGCDGGPATLPVCGMCGVLSDSSHPVGAVISK